MTTLWRTFTNAAKDLGSFVILFFLLLLGFAFTGFILFGPQVEMFHDGATSISTSIQMSLGEFNYDQFKNVNRVLAPIFFAAFVLVVFYSAVNMFLAIVTDSFTAVNEQSESEFDGVAAIRERLSFFWATIKARITKKPLSQTDVKSVDRQIWAALELAKKDSSLMAKKVYLGVNDGELERVVAELLGPNSTSVQQDRLRSVLEKHLSTVGTSSKFSSVATLALRKKSFSDLVEIAKSDSMTFRDSKPSSKLEASVTGSDIPLQLENRISSLERKLDLILAKLSK